ncbi:cytochrome b translational activator protein CBS2 [Microdochium nivale]|nr:cytochrome b translational activator protein CBS2 [Microdochium nivale]
MCLRKITTKNPQPPHTKAPQRKKRLHVDHQPLSPALFAPTLFRTLGNEYREQRPGVPMCGAPPPPPPLPAHTEHARHSTASAIQEGLSVKSKSLDKTANTPMRADSEDPDPVSKRVNMGSETQDSSETHFVAAAAAATAAEAGSEPLPSWKAARKSQRLSDKIHLGGFSVQARYLLHALSGLEGLPPVQVLCQNYGPSAAWAKEGRSINIHDHLGHFVSSRPIICPQYVGPTKGKLQHLKTSYSGKTPMIANLVVNLDDYALVPFMHNVKKFINSNTTICLIHDGLGVIEDLDADVFTDPLTRPQYICGLTHHWVSRHGASEISVRHKWHKRSSALYLSTPMGSNGPAVPWSQLDVPPQTQHLLGLLSRSPEINAKTLPWNRFVQRTLPGMVHASLVDSISVMLGCRYNQIVEKRNARTLWNTMLTETLKIITAMPEIQSEPHMVTYFLSEKFRLELWGKLVRQDKTYSRWISLIKAGRRPPVDHFNGYFVRRALELGLSCKHNHTAMSVVQFKYMMRRDELSNFAGLGLGPYMADGDQLGSPEDGSFDNFERDI